LGGSFADGARAKAAPLGITREAIAATSAEQIAGLADEGVVARAVTAAVGPGMLPFERAVAVAARPDLVGWIDRLFA
jgi:hypothetical protein